MQMLYLVTFYINRYSDAERCQTAHWHYTQRRHCNDWRGSFGCHGQHSEVERKLSVKVQVVTVTGVAVALTARWMVMIIAGFLGATGLAIALSCPQQAAILAVCT
jgi:hypothetical protein